MRDDINLGEVSVLILAVFMAVSLYTIIVLGEIDKLSKKIDRLTGKDEQ